jgi:hypothetical protein
MNLNLSKYVNTARNIIVSNSPELLVGTAIVGVVTTGVLSARAGYKARGIVDDERAKRRSNLDSDTAETIREYQEIMGAGADLTPMEKAKLTWLCYAVPAVTGATTIASVIGTHTIHTKRHAAMAGLYAVTANRLDDVQTKAEELLGPKKTQQLQNATGQAAVNRNAPIDHELILLPNGQELMYEEYSGRWFKGSVPIVEQAVAEVNLKLAQDGDCSLNEYFDFLGLKPIPFGHEYGWSGKPDVTPSFGAVNTPDGRSAVSVYFHEAPRPQRG